MKINDVIKLTGLTAKAIRLYESKGLITISRTENGYRNYTMQDVEILKQIKLLRSVGISISDIKLLFSGVICLDELIEKRKAEILNESGKSSENYKACEDILGKGTLDELEAKSFTESEKISTHEHGRLCIGIDIGTTTACAVVYDIDSREQIEAYSLPHNSYIKAGELSEQSPDIIMEKTKKLLFHILDSYDKIVSIGITGQMHGIVYINSQGKAVSNLINWQDKRADIIIKDNKSTSELIYDITGVRVPTGYGIATHYYNMLLGTVPSEAVSLCSIMDLFAMEICESKKPLVHASIGASLGLFDIKENTFMYDKLLRLGIDKELLPSITDKSAIVGKCRGIDVSVPIGDNQASFLGSVSKNKDTLLVNMGTGSQISYACNKYTELDGELELRPFIEGKYLACGSALCGGFAYSMLEEFFRSYMVSVGMPDKSQYSTLNSLARQALDNKEQGLLVDAYFCGKRSEPSKRGSINMIDRYSFTPSALVLGVLKGMCKELYELYEGVQDKKSHIVASGGVVKRAEVLRELIAQCFGASVSTTKASEEAGTGSALFSALATNNIKYNDGFGKYIKEE